MIYQNIFVVSKTTNLIETVSSDHWIINRLFIIQHVIINYM